MCKNKALAKSKMFYTVIIRTIYGLCLDIAQDTGPEGYSVTNADFFQN